MQSLPNIEKFTAPAALTLDEPFNIAPILAQLPPSQRIKEHKKATPSARDTRLGCGAEMGEGDF